MEHMGLLVYQGVTSTRLQHFLQGPQPGADASYGDSEAEASQATVTSTPLTRLGGQQTESWDPAELQ